MKGKEEFILSDNWWPLQSAARRGVNQIFLWEREKQNTCDYSQSLLLNTGRVVKTRTLSILGEKRKPFVMIMRGRQYTGKWTLCMRLREPFAVVNKDYVAEGHRLGYRFGTQYTSVREKVYQLFTQTAREQIERYGFVCLDAPFTFQADIDTMIKELRRGHPDLPILVITVEAPQKDRKRRISQGRELVWFMQAQPPQDIFETEYADQVTINHNWSTQSIIINNADDSNPEIILQPVYEAISRLTSN